MEEIRALFPSLRAIRETSPKDTRYNCFAWAACDVKKVWLPNPDFYWPPGIAYDPTVTGYIAAFSTLGYECCENGDLEDGFEKVVIYRWGDGVVSHMARQLHSGKWTSKIGGLEDIEHHSPEELEGGYYGTVVQYMKRAVEV